MQVRIIDLGRSARRSLRCTNQSVQFSLLGILMLGVIGCSDLSDPSLPAGIQSPDTYISRSGGLMLAVTAERQFKDTWVDVTVKSGLFTDELTSRNTTGSPDFLDHRNMQGGEVAHRTLYQKLHKLRGQARIARAVLAIYASDLSPAILGRLLTFEAYAEVWLADMYCSGVPLSTVDFEADFTNRPSSTTDEVYTNAISLFDSALTISADSPGVQTLASVGKGRALQAMGRYEDAEAAVMGMQLADIYQTRMGFLWTVGDATSNMWQHATASDMEGENGLPYISSGDPRTAVHPIEFPSTSTWRGTSYLPRKYGMFDSTVVSIASFTDAQLITAEAALQRGEWGKWLSILNLLRTDGTHVRIDTVYSDSPGTIISSIDTVWEAGAGKVAGLGPLHDPGTFEGRVDLHFSERAAWLYLTGQRQGDLRRLVRKYGRSSLDVYPTGTYWGHTLTGVYGDDIDLPIPALERQNPLFRGCLERD